MEIFDCDQNSDEWLRVRCGIPTASAFKDVLAKGQGKTRRTYMLKLAGEIITGEPSENFTNSHMDRGHEMEADARETYAFMNDADPQLVGFVRNGRKGASPDALIGDAGAAEFKSKMPHILADVLLRDEIPSEHVAQVQGVLWVCEREWCDFVAYWPKMPLFVGPKKKR